MSDLEAVAQDDADRRYSTIVLPSRWFITQYLTCYSLTADYELLISNILQLQDPDEILIRT